MDIAGNVAALAVGTALPLVALAMVVRWRTALIARRAVSVNERRRDERVARRPGRQARLKWLASLRSHESEDDIAARTALLTNQCGLCGHLNAEGAVYCRRCGRTLTA